MAGVGSGRRPVHAWTSDPHTVDRRTRTSTSPGAGARSGILHQLGGPARALKDRRDTSGHAAPRASRYFWAASFLAASFISRTI